MKRIVLFTIALLSIGPLSLHAQLTLTPNPVIIEDVDITKSEVIAAGTIKNGFEEAKDLIWTRKITMLSENWTTAVCDKNTCYLTTTETAEFNLAAGEENTMNVYIYPENNEGMAIIEVMVQDKSDENIYVKGTYYFNAQPSTTTTLNTSSIKVYPNPSNGLFQVANAPGLDRIEVFSALGQRVSQFQALEGDSYDLSHLTNGTYLLRMLNANRQTIATQLIQKN